jgi:hypothetical protein
LTQEFRNRLDELRAFSEKQGKGLRVHSLAALTLSDWIEEVGELKADNYWKAHPTSQGNPKSGAQPAFYSPG